MAPNRCIVCNDERRTQIEEAMVADPGRNLPIGERYNIGKDSIRRHRAHLSPAMKATITKRESAGARSGVARLEGLADQATAVLEEARGKGDGKLQLEAVKRLESIVTTLMKVSGELDERPQVNVLNLTTSPEWTATRSVLLEALGPFPEAGRAVAARLLELEP